MKSHHRSMPRRRTVRRSRSDRADKARRMSSHQSACNRDKIAETKSWCHDGTVFTPTLPEIRLRRRGHHPATTRTRTNWSQPPTHTSTRFSKERRTWPWGYRQRTEGGAHTGNGPLRQCDVGVPSGGNLANRSSWWSTIGRLGLCTFGAERAGGSGARTTFSASRRQAALRAHATHLCRRFRAERW